MQSVLPPHLILYEPAHDSLVLIPRLRQAYALAVSPEPVSLEYTVQHKLFPC